MEASPTPGSGPNAPHPNAPPDEDPFFDVEGEDGRDVDLGAIEADGPSEAARRWADDAAAERETSEAEAESVEAEPEPTGVQPAESAAETPQEPQAAAEASTSDETPQEPDPHASAPQDGPKTPDRGYRVFNELKLTPEVLRALLAEFEDGDEPAPRVAYLELPLVRDRTVKGAVAKVYRGHRQSVGDTPSIAICPDRHWQVKHPRPRQRPVSESVEID